MWAANWGNPMIGVDEEHDEGVKRRVRTEG